MENTTQSENLRSPGSRREQPDITGRRFGRLVAIKPVPLRPGVKNAHWRCQCDCGSEREVRATRLVDGSAISCGCHWRRDRTMSTPACERRTRQNPNGSTGTKAGYMAHRNYGEPPCAACTEGARRAEADKRDLYPDRYLAIELKRRYNISLEFYREMFEAQGGRCAICRTGTSARGRFHVDHDHDCCPGDVSCGQCVRGLLCFSCNSALGTFKNVEILREAAFYLMRHAA